MNRQLLTFMNEVSMDVLDNPISIFECSDEIVAACPDIEILYPCAFEYDGSPEAGRIREDGFVSLEKQGFVLLLARNPNRWAWLPLAESDTIQTPLKAFLADTAAYREATKDVNEGEYRNRRPSNY